MSDMVIVMPAPLQRKRRQVSWSGVCLALMGIVAAIGHLSCAAPTPQNASVASAAPTVSFADVHSPPPSELPLIAAATPDLAVTSAISSRTEGTPRLSELDRPLATTAPTNDDAIAVGASVQPTPTESQVTTPQSSLVVPTPAMESVAPAAMTVSPLATATATPSADNLNNTVNNGTGTDTPLPRNFTNPNAPTDGIANSYIIILKDGDFETNAARLTTEIESANVPATGSIPLAPSAIVPPSAAAAMVSAVNASAPVDPEITTSEIRAAQVHVPAGRAPTRFRNGRPVPAFDVNNPPNQITQAYPDMSAVAAVLTPDVVERLQQRSDVAEVVRDGLVKTAGWVVRQQDAPSWGLTRISYRDNEVNEKTDYAYDDTAGQDVIVWVIDTGVNHFDPDFEGRVAEGRAFCTDCYAPVPDPNGHGSAVAALIASKTWGVAKKARIVSVRALNEDGMGRWSDVIAALQWIRSNMRRRQFRLARGHIVNLSIEGPLNTAVNRMLRELERMGVIIVAAAGNSAVDACTTSPASATAMLNNMVVVGASTADDQPAYFTNVGTCVDVFGPGDEVVTIGDMAVSGTSFASPHAAGTMALYLSSNWRILPPILKSVLMRQATRGKVQGAELTQTPNVLVFNSLQGLRLPPWWIFRGGRWW